jgi:DNA replication protein DnaC
MTTSSITSRYFAGADFKRLTHRQAGSGAARLLKKLSNCEPQIIDDIGQVQHCREETGELLKFLADRYERHSVWHAREPASSRWLRIFMAP